ncbi:hypothetical protein MRX96_041076 [Rhipicephalus microplus]
MCVCPFTLASCFVPFACLAPSFLQPSCLTKTVKLFSKHSSFAQYYLIFGFTAARMSRYPSWPLASIFFILFFGLTVCRTLFKAEKFLQRPRRAFCVERVTLVVFRLVERSSTADS